jgi:LmbE family N-acetylglucosaminyl deacetylase
MLTLSPSVDANRPLSALCLGAHSDDIEIGCGGTLLHLRNIYPQLQFHWVVFSGAGIRGDEAKKGAELFAAERAHEIIIKGYRDGFLPYGGMEVKDFFEELKLKVNPDLIFTHWRADAHQDHRLVNELTWNTFRDHLILEYEIPKFDGDMGRPNVFVPLEVPLYQQKINHLLEAFKSQSAKRWFDPETFLGLMRIRGMECNARSGYAEAFYCHKLVLQPSGTR